MKDVAELSKVKAALQRSDDLMLTSLFRGTFSEVHDRIELKVATVGETIRIRDLSIDMTTSAG